MVFCFILGAACAVAIYFGASRLGTYLIDRYYLDETATLQREQALMESFDAYVQAGNLTSEDSDAIGAWAEDMRVTVAPALAAVGWAVTVPFSMSPMVIL